MSASKKLITSVKALSYLAKNEGKPLQSKEVAEHIDCNASKLRSLFAMLVKSDILMSTQGKQGGFTLKRPASMINLQQVYCAIEARKAFHMDFNCEKDAMMKGFEPYFERLFEQIQIEIEEKMTQISLQEIIDKTKRIDDGILKNLAN